MQCPPRGLIPFIKKFQSTTAWLYKEAGAAKVDPATLGIAKP